MILRSKLLITGATGFIGRSLALEGWARGLPLRVASRRAVPPPAAGIGSVLVSGLDADTDWGTALEEVGVVIHCAARAHIMRESPGESLVNFMRVNCDGTVNLASQAARAGVRRFIFISSIGVNGPETFGKAFEHDDAAAPFSPYTRSKHEAEMALQDLSTRTGMEVVVIRPPLVYGAGARGNFESMVRWLEAGIPLPLGAVRNERSLVAIDNLVDLILLCARHPAASNQTLLVCDGEDLSTTELLRRLGRALGSPPRLIPVPQALLKMGATLVGRSDIAQKLLGSLKVDAGYTRKLLDWSPPLGVDDALRRFAAARAPIAAGSIPGGRT